MIAVILSGLLAIGIIQPGHREIVYSYNEQRFEDPPVIALMPVFDPSIKASDIPKVPEPIRAPSVRPSQTLKTPPKTEIVEKIVETAIKYDYPPEKALAIARAESGFDANAKNASSTASGVYQFINGTAQGFCVDGYGIMESLAEKNDADKQIECAVKMLSEGGEKHWDASAHIWKKEIDLTEKTYSGTVPIE